MPTTVTKNVQDAAYATVGVGVLGYQQAQVRRRDAQAKLGSLARDARSQAEATADAAQGFLSDRADDAKATIRPALATLTDWAEQAATEIGSRVEPIVQEVRERLEPFVDRVQAKVNDLTGKAGTNGTAKATRAGRA
jgi:uncharacterized protein YjbJ (UPF0337 family)